MQFPNGRQVTAVGWSGADRVIYTIHQNDAQLFDVYRNGDLIKSDLLTLQAALDCARADEKLRELEAVV